MDRDEELLEALAALEEEGSLVDVDAVLVAMTRAYGWPLGDTMPAPALEPRRGLVRFER